MTRIAVIGAGAFGRKHLDVLQRIETADVRLLVGRPHARAKEVAQAYGVPDTANDLSVALDRDDVDAVILCTPTPLHTGQAIAALRAGKHVQVEIPMADSGSAAEELARVQRESGLVCMAGHTRRFNPSHRWIRRRIIAGQLRLQQLVAQTHFLRRQNLNALGEARDWTDHLLWHHAAHTVDLLRYQTGEEIAAAHALQGPPHPRLGIAMDMSVQLATTSGVVCTLSLSFNNDGPLGTVFRYIGDTGTYVARYDDLETGYGDPVDASDTHVPADGVEGQDREFVAAISEGRVPEADVHAVLPSYRVLARLDEQLRAQTARVR